jgi:hypothetical protein
MLPTSTKIVEVLDSFENAVEQDANFTTAIIAARDDNKSIDDNVKNDGTDSHLLNLKTQKPFKVYKGNVLNHPMQTLKNNTTMCANHWLKDRRFSDLAESLNISLGVELPRKTLVSGFTSSTALFACFLSKHDKLWKQHYEELATLCS